MRTRAMRRQASGMPSSLPPQLVMTWLPIRDVAAALRVSKDWCGASEPLFQAIAARHGRRREESWKAAVQRFFCQEYESTTAYFTTPNDILIGAAQRNDVPAIQTCVYVSGANPSYANHVGQTPLHIAALWGNVDALNTLIAAGADLNAQNIFNGATPLHICMEGRHALEHGDPRDREACARRLLEAGANARLLDKNENAPYQVTPHQGLDPNNPRELLKGAFRAQR